MLSWQLTLNCFSALFPSGAVRILQETHTSARRRRSQRSLHYAPLGFGAIQRVERVSLPLVPRTCFLSTTQTNDPHFKATKKVATHTQQDVFQQPVSRPSCEEKCFQGTISQTFTFENWTLCIVMGVVSQDKATPVYANGAGEIFHNLNTFLRNWVKYCNFLAHRTTYSSHHYS